MDEILILLGSQVGNISILMKTLQATSDETTQLRALHRFLGGAWVRVFDMQRQQYVNEKDFINKNFAGG